MVDGTKKRTKIQSERCGRRDKGWEDTKPALPGFGVTEASGREKRQAGYLELGATLGSKGNGSVEEWENSLGSDQG